MLFDSPSYSTGSWSGLHDLHHQVRLLAHDEEHEAERERVQEAEVGVRPVRDEDVPAAEVRRRGLRPHGIMVPRVLDDREGRQEVAEHVVHVELRGRRGVEIFGGIRLTICRRMGYTVFVASGGGVFMIL